MIAALAKAFRQLSDVRLRRVLKLGVLGALAAYVSLAVLVWWGMRATDLFPEAWADTLADAAAIAVALVLPILFFPALTTVIMGPMLEEVADAVEARHYPQLAPVRKQHWAEVVGMTLRFLAVTVTVNLLALPIYGVLLLTGLTFVLAYLVNGYLLGREFFELVALRRMDPKAAKILLRNRLGMVWAAGAIIAFLFSIPFLNLTAPVVATAFMTHLFQALQPPATNV